MSAPLRVLLVEDSATDAKLILHALKGVGRAVEHARVEDALAMRDALEAERWDVVISDWSMPRFNARAALDVLQASGKDIPFIVAWAMHGLPPADRDRMFALAGAPYRVLHALFRRGFERREARTFRYAER